MTVVGAFGVFGRLDRSEEVVRLQRDRVVLQYAREVVRNAGRDGVLTESLDVVALHDVVERGPLVRERIGARRRRQRFRSRGRRRNPSTCRRFRTAAAATLSASP